ncbi:MAG: Ig-like domain-containing protein, partial [Promethearchaeota archaeon]
MKFLKNKSLIVIFIIIFSILPIYNKLSNIFSNPKPFEELIAINPQAINRTGKTFENITVIEKDCYINKEMPNLNNQPDVYIPDYNISYAKMFFENITALNYTRNIEEDFSEFIFSSANGPTYVYQKFSVEIDQYVNNVSFLIQDINDPTSFTDENSWEVSILNCLNDIEGTPNSFPNGTLGSLKKPHPITFAAHWEVFDFKNSDMGPVYLNTSNTKMTIENGIEKYWFAFKIKIPKTEIILGRELTKFLYFNPDDDNVGEGHTFATSPDFYYDAYTINNVNVSEVKSGNPSTGTLESFKDIDEDRYSAYDANNVTIDIKVHLEQLKNTPYTYFQLLNLLKFLNWRFDHYKYIFSFDFYLMVNVSDISRIQNATISIYNYGGKSWIPLPYDINQANETLIYIPMKNPWEKLDILRFMDNSAGRNNTLRFKLEYIGNGSGNFSVSINQFKVEVGEIENLDTMQRYDPLVQKLSIPNNVLVINESIGAFGDQSIDALEYNDDDYYQAQAHTSNLSFFLTFNVLNDIDSSLWDIDYYDWLVSYPNPIVPLMDIRISSNVSSPDNLDLAALALYKGNATFDLLEPEENKAEWILLSGLRKFANLNETTTIFQYDAGFTWLFLHILNESRDNEVNFILIYLTNETLDYGFNVSINEFSINFYIQNAITSDISSKIGLGIDNNNLTPSYIGLQNFGIDINDNGIGKGIWEAEIDNAFISEGYFEFNVTSLWYAIRFDVNGTYERFKIIPELEFIGSIATQYMTGTSFFSARITEAGGKPLANFEIIFEVLGPIGGLIYEVTAVSNEEGIATATLNFETTGEGFNIRVRFAEEGMYTDAEIVSGDIRIVDDFILFMDNFFQFLPYIIIGATAIATLVTVRQIRHSKLKK